MRLVTTNIEVTVVKIQHLQVQVSLVQVQDLLYNTHMDSKKALRKIMQSITEETKMPNINTLSNEDRATELLEEARNTLEKYFYLLRDEALDSDQLFEMRIALQDATDTISIACRHIEAVQREVEATEGDAE